MADAKDAGRKPRAGRWRATVWGGAAVLLLLPFLASRVTPEVDWDGADYLLFGGMLVCAGLAAEALVRMTRTPGARLIGGLAIGAAFLLVWAELAVGVLP